MGGMAIRALRMTLLAVITIPALIAVVAPIALGVRALAPLRLSLRRRLQPLERVGMSSEPGRERRNVDPLARRALDVAQIAALVRAAERDRDAGCAGACGTADAMDILLGHVGQIEVHHMADTRDVDPARCDVGGDQHRHVARLEAGESALALRLALVAVDRAGGDACGVELLYDLVGAM